MQNLFNSQPNSGLFGIASPLGGVQRRGRLLQILIAISAAAILIGGGLSLSTLENLSIRDPLFQFSFIGGLLSLGIIAFWFIRKGFIDYAIHVFYAPLFIGSAFLIFRFPEFTLLVSYLLLICLAAVSIITTRKSSALYSVFCYFTAALLALRGGPGLFYGLTVLATQLIIWFFTREQRNTMRMMHVARRNIEVHNHELQARAGRQRAKLSHTSDQLKLSIEIGRAADSPLRLNELLREIAQSLHTHLQLNQVLIFLVNESTQLLELKEATRPLSQDEDSGDTAVAIGSDSLIGLAAKHLEPYHASSHQPIGRYALQGTQSDLALPLISQGRLVGVLNLQSKAADVFSHEVILILQLTADQIACHIKNAFLYDQLVNQAENFSELQTITNLMSFQATTQNALTVLAQRARKLVNADSAGVFLAHPSSHELELVINLNLGDGSTGATIPIGQGLAGRCFAEGKTFVVDDYGTWPNRLLSFADANLHALMNVPLKEREEVIGVLSLGITTPNRLFSEDNIRIIELLATQAGTIITNQQLIEDMQQLVRRERVLNKISAEVRRSLDAEMVLESAATQLGQALGDKKVSVKLYPTRKVG